MMKISILIPTKDGGEGFADLISSIDKGTSYVKRVDKRKIEFNINFLINGDPKKPTKYLDKITSTQIINKIFCPKLGKVNAIYFGLKNISADIYILMDDDVIFNQDNIYLSINDLLNHDSLKLV